MVTPAGPPPNDQPSDEDADRELTVDELAARVGVTVRNVRAYSARGLLPAPRMAGRTGYYGREHVARLLLVREMLAEGYSLAMIERTLASAPVMTSGSGGSQGDSSARCRASVVEPAVLGADASVRSIIASE